MKAQTDALSELGLTVSILHIRGDRSLLEYAKSVFTVRRRVREFQPDVIYAFYGLSGWVALWQGLPIVLSLAGDDILGTPDGKGGRTLKSKIGIFLSQWAASRSDVVCIQSDEMRRKLWSARLRRDAHVVPYGVDPLKFSPGDQATARRKLALPADALIALFPNTPTEVRKRLDLAQAAIDIAKRSLPKLELLIITRVPHEVMPDYFRAANCCLITSDWEGSPNVVKEALLCGLPVVSTDVGDVREWVGVAPGSVICNRTSEDIAAGLVTVLGSPRRIDPRPFVSRFSSEAIALRMIDLFRSASS